MHFPAMKTKGLVQLTVQTITLTVQSVSLNRQVTVQSVKSLLAVTVQSLLTSRHRDRQTPKLTALRFTLGGKSRASHRRPGRFLWCHT